MLGFFTVHDCPFLLEILDVCSTRQVDLAELYVGDIHAKEVPRIFLKSRAKLLVDRIEIIIGGLPCIGHNEHVIDIDRDVHRGAVRVVLGIQAGVVMTPGEAVLEELSVKRPIPNAAGIALPVVRRLLTPDVHDSTMVSSAKTWRRSKTALLKRC